MSVAAPEIATFGDDIIAKWGGSDVIFHFSRLTEHRDTLSAELSITNGPNGHLHWSRVNLASAGGRHAVVKALEDEHPDKPWRAMLDRSCQAVARHLRAGEPATGLVPAPPAADRWLITNWMPLNEITVLYGAGGSAKSLLALSVALGGILGHTLGSPWAVGSIKRALYLDWESTKATHEGRMWGLTRAIEAPPLDSLLYRRLRRPLTDVIGELRAECARHGIDFVILDSLVPASGPEPESADAASRTLQALDSLPGTKLAVGHSPKGDADKAQGSLFGSVMNTNLARSAIEVRRQESVGDEPETSVSLYHRKANNGPKVTPTGVTFRFDDDGSIRMSRAKADSKSSGLPDQILDALRSGGQKVSELADALGADKASVRTTLHRLETREKVVRLPTRDGEKESLWGRRDSARLGHA